MIAIGRIRRGAALGLVMVSTAWFQGVARGQAVAYEPIVSPLLNGTALTATPVVSADRLYVRMTLNPYFNTVNGFSTYSAPVAAVSGGGNLAGMGGVIGGGGLVGPSGPMTGFSQTGTYLAGEYTPPAAQPGAGFGGSMDPFDQVATAPRGAAGANRHLAGQALAGDQEGPDPFALADAPDETSVRAGNVPAARRKAARKPIRRPATTKAKRRP
jgi:hypothetical protein